MSSTSTQSTLPPTSELVEGVLFYPIALVISATIFPGLTLCIPGLIFATALILLPLVAIALVIALAVAIVAAPFVLVRSVRGLLERRAEARLVSGRRRERGAPPQPVTIKG